VPALEFSGQVISFEVRRSTRARNARIVVHPWNGVEVVLPARSPSSDAERMVRAHHAWLLARIAERPATPPPLVDGVEIPWRGDRVVLRVHRGRGAARLAEGELMIAASDPADPAAVGRSLERAARDEAKRLLALEVAETAAELGVQPTALTVRDPRTRWGSCTRPGRLSFSWRLVLAPPAVLRYVAVHEVCHMVEPNHQRPFWALVERLMPDYREHRLWLRRHGTSLRF
jgi:predicted metal-dependent hydrolase